MNWATTVWNKPYKKSAAWSVTSSVSTIRTAILRCTTRIVRMAQPFSLRYMLVDGQGNFGSVDGDAPAAMRYTEVRMARIAHELLADIDKETVDFGAQLRRIREEPPVLPARIPEPAGQRLLGHRGRHGDQHPAAQPHRGDRCLLA